VSQCVEHRILLKIRVNVREFLRNFAFYLFIFYLVEFVLFRIDNDWSVHIVEGPVRTPSDNRARIFKLLRSLGIDSKESIPPANEAPGWPVR
jgi:hypothetical protein